MNNKLFNMLTLAALKHRLLGAAIYKQGEKPVLTILMYHGITHHAFWVNTPEFAQQLHQLDVGLTIVTPDSIYYESTVKLAGSNNLEEQS